MKKLMITVTALPMFLLTAPAVQAYETLARVVQVTPIKERVYQPEKECWTEYQQTTRRTERYSGGAVLGTIVGGLLGNEVGKGRGTKVATVVGAATGAVIGDRMQNKNVGSETVTTPVQQCRTVDRYHERVAGYEVAYEYQGYRYTTRLPHHPGRELRVNVAVTPL
jgi:uncharacterized protein YcfJ